MVIEGKTMENMIGLAVGSTLHKGKFVALILKFQLGGGQQVLTSWNRDRCLDLTRASLEYMQYLQARQVEYNGDSVEESFKQNSPDMTSDDVEAPPVSSVVTSLGGHVNTNHELQLTINLHEAESPIRITIQPKYIEWLFGYVANCLNEFDEKGSLFQAPDILN